MIPDKVDRLGRDVYSAGQFLGGGPQFSFDEGFWLGIAAGDDETPKFFIPGTKADGDSTEFMDVYLNGQITPCMTGSRYVDFNVPVGERLFNIYFYYENSLRIEYQAIILVDLNQNPGDVSYSGGTSEVAGRGYGIMVLLPSKETNPLIPKIQVWTLMMIRCSLRISR